MNRYLLFIVSFIAPCLYGFSETHYKNIPVIQAPELPQASLFQLGGVVAVGSAVNAFNAQGKQVPFLQQYGQEDMLARFTNTALDRSDITSLGKGLMQGKLRIYQFSPHVTYNFNSHWGIQLYTTIEDIAIKNITPTFDQEGIITAQQQQFLKDLETKIPKKMNLVSISEVQLIGTYNRTFDDFDHIDFLDLTLKTGVISPEWQHSKHNTLFNTNIFAKPHFKYPLHASMQVGLLDWINCGCNGSVTFFQKSSTHMPINHNKTINNLLIQEKADAKVEQEPFLSYGCFIIADHILDFISLTAEYKYMQQGERIITPINESNFPYLEANESSTLKSWDAHQLSLQLELDYATQTNPNAPLIKIGYSMPLQGKYTTITPLWSGSLAFQICYNF